MSPNRTSNRVLTSQRATPGAFCLSQKLGFWTGALEAECIQMEVAWKLLPANPMLAGPDTPDAVAPFQRGQLAGEPPDD